MKKQIQNNSNAGQSNAEVRKSQKHDVNLQKNTMLYFQIGLILCLLGTFALFEMRFESKIYEVAQNQPELEELYETSMPTIKEYVPEAKPEPKSEIPKKIIDEVLEVENDHKDIVQEVITQEQNITSKPTEILKPEDVAPVDPPIIDNVHVNAVQFVPIFPGCEKYELNSKRRKCLNEKMGKLVKRKFDNDIAGELGLSGLQRILVQFTVDKTGVIKDIKTRAPHPKLEKEALRIANKIPEMIPGKMGTEPVNVIYNLPITFRVNN